MKSAVAFKLIFACTLCCTIIFQNAYCSRSLGQDDRVSDAVSLLAVEDVTDLSNVNESGSNKEVTSSVEYAGKQQKKDDSLEQTNEKTCVCDKKAEELIERPAGKKADLQKSVKPKKYKVITITLPDELEADAVEPVAQIDETKKFEAAALPDSKKDVVEQDEKDKNTGIETADETEAAEVDEEKPKVEEKVTQKKDSVKDKKYGDKKRSKRATKGGKEGKGGKSSYKRQQSKGNSKRSKVKETKGKK